MTDENTTGAVASGELIEEEVTGTGNTAEGGGDQTSVTVNTGEAAPKSHRKRPGKKATGKVKKATTPKKAGKPKAGGKKPKKPSAPKDKKPGVIAVTLECMQRPEGASATEILKELKKRFPDRGDGMLTTIRIQATRLPARCGFEMKKTKDEKRGLVYKAPKSAKLVE